MRLKNKKNILATATTILLLSGCGAADRLADIGKPPSMSPIENPADNKQNLKMNLNAHVQAVKMLA